MGAGDTDSVSNCFYDSTTTGMSDTNRGTPKTTAEMQSINTYTLVYVNATTGSYGLSAAWDFTGTQNNDSGTGDIWAIDSSINGGYPYLKALAGSY